MRVGSVDIPDHKPVATALTYIYGIGRTTARQILAELHINSGQRTKDLSEAQLTAVRRAVGQRNTEGDLRREVAMSIKRLMDIGAYRGIRHRRCLPVRGQSSKQNARTCKRRKTGAASRGLAVKKHMMKKK